MKNKIYMHILTAGQQGGIGYPPIVVRLEKLIDGRKIYGIDNSRVACTPEIIEKVAIYPHRFLSEYGHKIDEEWRSQQWILTAWRKSPRITWDELIEFLTRPQKEAK